MGWGGEITTPSLHAYQQITRVLLVLIQAHSLHLAWETVFHSAQTDIHIRNHALLSSYFQYETF